MLTSSLPLYHPTCENKICEIPKINFLTYFWSNDRHVKHQVNVPHQAWCNDDVRIANLYGGIFVAMFCLITSEVLKLEVVIRKFVKVQNLNFLTYFWSKGRHVKHQVNVPLWALWNGNGKITSSYGWKGHSDVLPHNIWRIEGRKVQNLSEVNIVTATQLVKRKFVKVQNLNFLTYFWGKGRHVKHQVNVLFEPYDM